MLPFKQQSATQMTWADGSGGGTPLDAANLNQAETYETTDLQAGDQALATWILTERSWLGLNGNSATGFGAGNYWSEQGFVYDRFDCHQGSMTAVQAATAVGNSITLGMIPVVIIESPGYSGPGALPTGAGITTFANFFVSVVQAVEAAHPGVALYEIENEPWGSWFWTTPTAAQYAAEVVGVITACQTANLDLNRIYPMVSDETYVAAMYSAQPTLKTTAAPQGWSVHPYGPVPPGFTTGAGIAAVPNIRAAVASGQNNWIVSEAGFRAYGVSGDTTPYDGGRQCSSDTEAAVRLIEMLREAARYHDEGWLTALLIYSRSDRGWSMQLSGGTLTKQGQALQNYPQQPPQVANTNPVVHGAFERAAWVPSDDGFICATIDPQACGTDAVTPAAAGHIWVGRVAVAQKYFAGYTTAWIMAGGATGTSGQCFSGWYDEMWNLIVGSPSQHTAWQSSGHIDIQMSSGQWIGVGYLWVALLWNGGTPPTWLGKAGPGTGAGNIGNTGLLPSRLMVSTNTYTSLPSSLSSSNFAKSPNCVALAVQ